MRTGKVKKWIGDRGFGFILPDDGLEDLFVHVSGLANGLGKLSAEQRVAFEVGTDQKTHRQLAINVQAI